MTDQEYLDRCAVEAMNGILSGGGKYGSGRPMIGDSVGVSFNEYLATQVYDLVEIMFAERKKRMETEKMKSTEECGDCGFQLVMCPKHEVTQEWENPEQPKL